jgi:hypothetical protein
VALRRHLVVNAIEAPDLGERKEPAKKNLLTSRDQRQGDRGEEQGDFETMATQTASAVRLGGCMPDPLEQYHRAGSAAVKWPA